MFNNIPIIWNQLTNSTWLYFRTQISCLLRSALSTRDLGTRLDPVVQKLDSAIHRINHYPLGKYFTKTNLRYSLYSDLPSGQRYPPFEQLGPEFVPLIYLVTML